MRRNWFSKIFALGLLLLACQVSVVYSAPRPDRFQQRMMVIRDELDPNNPNCSSAIPKAEELILELSRPGYNETLAPYFATGVLMCAVQNDKHEAVLKFGPLAEQFLEFREFAIRSQLYALIALERSDALFEKLQTLNQENETSLLNQRIELWWRFLYLASTSTSPNDNRILVYDLAKKAKYSGFSVAEKRTLEMGLLQTLLLSNGDASEINRLLGGLDNVLTAVELMIDKQYDSVRSSPHFSRLLDFREIAAQDLAFRRSQVVENPKSLEAITSLARMMRSLGQREEALALLESALSKLSQDENYFTDLEEELNWVYDTKASLFSDLGRYEEAVVALSVGRDLREFEERNVSQTINLASMQISHGHYDDALATLGSVGANRSRYADSLVAGLRSCATFQKNGSDPQLPNTIVLLRALGRSGQSSLISTYICVGDVDSAAEEFLKQLENPETRTDAIISAITHKNRLPIDYHYFRQTNPRIVQLLARPEIVEAINRLGNRVEIPFYWPQHSF